MALTTPSDTANNRPPCKRQAAAILDYNSDRSDTALAPVTSTATNQSGHMSSQSTTTPIDYAAELKSLKQEIADLRSIVTVAVEKIKSAIASNPTPRTSTSNDMDTATVMATNNPCQLHAMETDADQSPTATKSDISDYIADLKQDIATVAIEMRAIVDVKSDIALIKSHPLYRNLQPINQQIPVT